ncbi:DUF72 domain-containing protein [Plantactinospora sp. GCM10030261]|uniref:DUF72 domain-containing protein n=1 Tax=Plantactinospora sp. GCM10030261 TaxID=3273420 RepID=UPI00360BE3A2
MIRVGTSGWQYRDWRGRFYPAGLAQRRWLEHFAAKFDTVEINNAFYRLPERDTFAQWRSRTPDDFCVAVKMSRFLTHIKRLRDPEEPVDRFLGRATALGDRLGPVLLQLPPNLPADVAALDRVLGLFPTTVRVAVEPRHPSWWTDRVRETLAVHGAALSWADRNSRPVTPLWRTTDWGYLRMHEGRARPWPRYGRTALTTWVRRIAERFGADEPVHVYFNNDPGGAAIIDAVAFAALARRQGLPVGRTPLAPPAGSS